MAIINYNPPSTPWIDVLYQDDDILVLNKPSGLLSVPGKQPEHKDSLQSRVLRVFPTATVVHRLDMATSGIMLFALNKAAHKNIGQQFERRQTQKRYFARIFGIPAQQQGSIDLPLICDWPNRPKQKVDSENGKQALTHYKVLHSDIDWSLVELTPITGRSHQLRVHMLSLGHPILGDRLYAHQQALTMAPRLQLHASELGITHPVTGKTRQFNSPHPFQSEKS